jgi:diguanylate cyclase (GGDEF)-like protein
MHMTRLASQPHKGPEAGIRPPTPPSGLEDVLRRFQTEINAVAIGLSLSVGSPAEAAGGDSGLSLNVSRSDEATRLLNEVWTHSAATLLEQARTAAGAIGTNKLKASDDGPVCGKLMATGLRDPAGKLTGLVVLLRTVEQDKFGAKESQRLLELAKEITALLSRAPEPPQGLVSWSAFEDRAAAHERSATSSGCVLYGNVDQLHVLNKLAGFSAGDRAIAAVAETLRDEKLPEGAGACHVSGDRFAIYLPATTLIQGRRVAEHLSRTVSDRCSKLDGLRTRLSISFGVAAIPVGDNGVTEALASAAAACRAARERGRGRVEVHQQPEQNIAQKPKAGDEGTIAGKLRRALDAQRIGIVAQQLVSLNGDARTEYYELLVRFIDDTGALLAPGPFASAATRYQLLTELDRAVVQRVLERLKAARERLEGRSIRFSINLSGPTMSDSAFLDWLSASIGPHNVPGEWLQFELTESAAVANVAQTQAMIQRLRPKGVEFALDDYGTGASSFTYLKTFDVSMLKLDESFARELLKDARTEALVGGIAQLGRVMGIQTAMEYVETQEVRDKLAALGVDRAQGFLFGQPVAFESILSGKSESAGESAPAAESSATDRRDPLEQTAAIDGSVTPTPASALG